MYSKTLKLLPDYRSLGKETIENIVKKAPDTGSAVVGLYKACYPDEWDSIELLNGHPTVNKETWNMICDLLMEKEKAVSPTDSKASVKAGLFWMNTGFSADESVPENKVKLCGFTLKEGVNHAN